MMSRNTQSRFKKRKELDMKKLFIMGAIASATSIGAFAASTF